MIIPENYQPTPSKVEGITILAPVPVSEKAGEPKSFMCPNCGASLTYDVSAGGIACQHCGFVKQNDKTPVGLSAQELEFDLETWTQAEKGWGIERKELFCSQCGGVISLPDVAIATTCPFCASNQVNLRSSTYADLRPKFLVPFKITEEKARDNISTWLGKGWFHPKELTTNALIERMAGIFFPFWTFDARIEAEWKAEVGYERQTRYFDGHSGEWKTRTVVDWRWESNKTAVKIDDLIISGSTHANRKILIKLLPYDLTGLVNYDPEYLAGLQAHSYDISLPDAWNEAKDKMRDAARDACYAQINSFRVRNFSMVADFSDEKWRYLLLPVYLSSYRYNEKIFQVMINGVSGSVAGHKPVDWQKVWLAIILLFIPGVLIGLIGLPLTLFGGIGVFPLIVGFILVIIAAAISFWIYNQAAESEPKS